jgi:hypothetical protein
MERPDGTLVDDVVIDDWRRPWNLRSDRPLGGIPSSSLWATEPAGFGQVGCIYTAKGFEYDFAGVIIGPRPGLAGRSLADQPDSKRRHPSAPRTQL